MQEADAHHAVVLLDADMVSVDIWQLVNWPTRWARAAREMAKGRVLVLPAFQLTQTGQAAMGAALKVATAGEWGWGSAVRGGCGFGCAGPPRGCRCRGIRQRWCT